MPIEGVDEGSGHTVTHLKAILRYASRTSSREAVFFKPRTFHGHRLHAHIVHKTTFFPMHGYKMALDVEQYRGQSLGWPN